MIISHQEFQDRIKQLVDVSITLLKWTSEYKQLYEKYKPSEVLNFNKYATSPIAKLLRFQSCSLFFDSVLNINTLLGKVQKDQVKKEISFFEFLNLQQSSSDKDKILIILDNELLKFQSHKLDKIRNKFIGHKDLSINFDPVTL